MILGLSIDEQLQQERPMVEKMRTIEEELADVIPLKSSKESVKIPGIITPPEYGEQAAHMIEEQAAKQAEFIEQFADKHVSRAETEAQGMRNFAAKLREDGINAANRVRNETARNRGVKEAMDELAHQYMMEKANGPKR